MMVGPSNVESLSAIWLIPYGEASPHAVTFAYTRGVLVGPSGLEPPTSCLSGTRSNHLIYEPVYSTSCSEKWKVKSEELWLKFECLQISSLLLIFYLLLEPRWWRWWDSNPWPPACRAGALPAELHPHIFFMGLCFFLLKDPSKLNNDLSKYSTFYELRLFVAYMLVIYGRFSIERRWSSRTFRYGYLVTT